MSSAGEQLTIFGLISPDDRFCFDDDILSYIIDIKEKPHKEFVDKLYEVMKFAEDRRIELSAHSIGNKLYLFSTFLDNRQKVKQDREFRYKEGIL